MKSQCKECGGSSLCAHGNQKHQCKECGARNNLWNNGILKRSC
jgi:tRNA(Ile2) C34 agmatinyltransferase TiaS